MNILITVCGRAGSTGVKNKNVRNFLGFPLINYTVAAANLFKKENPNYNIDLSINSDSEELLNMFNKNKDIICIERPTELAQQNSPKVPVIRYSLNYVEKKLNKIYDYIIDLDITSPLRKTVDIENALKKAISNLQTDVVFSVVHSRRNPYFNMVEDRNGKIKKIISSDFVTRQQAPQVYDMNASIYCYKRNSLINVLKNSPLEGNYDIVLMKDTAVIDIDSEEDFKLMEVLGEYFFKDEFNELYRYINNIKTLPNKI
ncbi:acylneuraminate cytidylyltransferase family protein [Clostridium estertheticum]|uniref:acylneuraminate cytidylyltransferase family protein n=1 Tax=Clostridium estertheticum TaxID=238834 RepID=UPI001CF57063|nr:acylneuraminate cytidylyltransferase family protein [Clostridium estertheticum]MCB2342096.1 acylneuraminate cytidylyltransferase family protein [Clostridium estertheticum]